jgi:hypothetical protein
MTVECELLSEKMPAVAHGDQSWTREEAAHLTSCFECAAEWRLIQRAARLGESAALTIDPASLSAAVGSQVARRARRDRWARGAWMTGLAAAAAIAVMVFTGRGGQAGSLAVGSDSGAAVGVDLSFHLPLSELESLDSDQLQTVLDGLDGPVSEVEPGPAPSFGDLDDNQLERVLRSLEG